MDIYFLDNPEGHIALEIKTFQFTGRDHPEVIIDSTDMCLNISLATGKMGQPNCKVTRFPIKPGLKIKLEPTLKQIVLIS